MTAIYLDHAAATPLRPEVRAAMEPILWGGAANPSSLHRWGRRASAALEEARAQVAASVGVAPGEVYFVRGGTESANLAVLGRAEWARGRGLRPRVALSSVEHRAVLETARGVAGMGGEPLSFAVDGGGRPDPAELERVLATRPALLSLLMVNNETGTLHPVEAVGARCREEGVVFHVDGAQAPGRAPLDLSRLPIDLLSLSGHKVGGPPGTGVLVVRKGVELGPRLFGGGQERGLRPGTEDVAGAVGMATALARAVEELPVEAPRLASLRDALETRLRERIPEMRVHGAEGPRAPHILNVGFPGVEPGLLLPALDREGVAASQGSACSSGTGRPSHVLEAMLGPLEAGSAAPLRLSLGWPTTREEVEEAAGRIATVVLRLRALQGAAP